MNMDEREAETLKRIQEFAEAFAKLHGFEGMDFTDNEMKRAKRDAEVRAQRGNRQPITFVAPVKPSVVVEEFSKSFPGVVKPA